MDLRMPEVSGTDALGEIRDRAGPNQDVPILAFTADADLALLGGDHGFDGLVSKPIMAADLVEAVDRCTRWDGVVRRGRSPSTSRRPEVGRTRILVVEDDPIILDLITTRLDIAGYDTYFARDGFEGLSACTNCGRRPWCWTSTCRGSTASACCARCAWRG
jgi:CheY-like chemotaxis protein